MKKEILVGIIVAVLGGLISVIVIDPSRKIIFKIISIIKDFFKNVVFHYLTTEHYVNGTVIILSFFLWIILIVILLIHLFKKIKGKEYKNYKEDVFFNVIWRWNWGYSDIEDLWCYCPHCDFELTYDDSSTRRYSHDPNPRTDFICDHCQKIISSIQNNDKNFIIGIIEREIRRKVRTGLYQNESKK
jgi:hypothetical protein